MSSSADSPASIRFMSARQVLSDALASVSIFFGTIGLPSKVSHEGFLEKRRSRQKHGQGNSIFRFCFRETAATVDARCVLKHCIQKKTYTAADTSDHDNWADKSARLGALVGNDRRN
jgi:hypothetical protein